MNNENLRRRFTVENTAGRNHQLSVHRPWQLWRHPA